MFFSSSRYNHLDLPIHDPETDVKFGPLTAAGVKAITDPGFVRAVRIRTPRRLGNLTEALKRTDEEFNLIAEHCGAVVVEHAWGLYPLPQRNVYDRFVERYIADPHVRRHLGIPRGQIVVAEVPVIRDFKELSKEEYAQTQKAVDEYRHLTRGPILEDMEAYQFGTIHPPTEATPGANTRDPKVLIDIEPLWKNPHATLLEHLGELFL